MKRVLREIGLVILPVLVLLVLLWLASSPWPWGVWILVVLAVAGWLWLVVIGGVRHDEQPRHARDPEAWR